jgi:hypothetical protein
MPVAYVRLYCVVHATIGTTSVKILRKYDNRGVYYVKSGETLKPMANVISLCSVIYAPISLPSVKLSREYASSLIMYKKKSFITLTSGPSCISLFHHIL